MVLIDGGTRNNFPTDLARAMGADVIIGVELSDAKSGYEQINNFADMIWQMIDMLSMQAFEDNLGNLTIHIKPDLHEYNMMSFGEEQIDTIINRGYAAAVARKDDLQKLRAVTGPSIPKYFVPAKDLSHDFVKISKVKFEGVDDKDAKYLAHRIKIQPGDTVGRADIHRAMSAIYGTGIYESLTYSLLDDHNKYTYTMRFSAQKGPVHRLSLGVRVDSEELVAILLGVGLNSQTLRGSRFEIEGKIGESWYGKLKYSLVSPSLPRINFESTTGYTNANVVSGNSSYHALGFWHNREALYFSGLRWANFDAKAGAKFEHYRLTSWMTNTGFALGNNKMVANRLALFGEIRMYTLDDQYYPSKGISLGVSTDWYANDSGIVPIAAADFRGVIPITSWLAMIPSLDARCIFTEPTDGFMGNFIGGSMRGRYLPQQIPFYGFHRVTDLNNYVSVVSLELRSKLYNNLYLSLCGSAAKDDDNFTTMLTTKTISYYGGALEIGYDTIVGPIKANVHWSNFLKWGAYFGIGFDF